MTATSSGNAGDILYSLPCLKQLGVKRLYVKDTPYPNGSNQHAALKRLIENQGIECLPTVHNYPYHKYEPGLQYDIDLDKARLQPMRGKNHIMLSYANAFGTTFSPEPWLTDTIDIKLDYSLIYLTSRWRDGSPVNWLKVLASIKGRKHFIGFDEDYTDFVCKYGAIEYMKCTDFQNMAYKIAACTALYCNQGPALVLAQALGVPYSCEFKPRKDNCKLYTDKENVL